MDLSLVIPLYNEAESLPELHRWIRRVCEANGLSYEILFVDDGSTDGSWKVLQGLKAEDASVRAIRFRRNYGKSAALNAAFESARGEVVITMDADLQDSPDEIPDLVKMIRSDGFDLVSGWKKVRHDPLSKTIPTRFYNWATRCMSGIRLHDFNCGLKAYRLDVVKSIEVIGEMHRYIPVMAKREGFSRIGEKVVEHRARKFGKSKFGFERFINGFLDLLTISFLSRFGKKPMHFFGSIGMLMFFVGFGSAAWIGLNKLWHVYISHTLAERVTDKASFYIALTGMVLGTLLFLAGFLGELIVRNGPRRDPYRISETL